MSFLNFDSVKQKTSGEKKSLAILLSISALVGIIALGTTLAASINLNSGAPVEFGQGVAQTAACDANGITLTPYSKFINGGEVRSEATSDFIFTGFSLSGISENCMGVIFRLKAYNDGENNALDIPSDPSGNSASFYFDETGWHVTEFSFITTDNEIYDSQNNNGAQFDWSNQIGDIYAALAKDVDRITLESTDNPNFTKLTYSIGQTGPGGGEIFYRTHTSFTCGVNLSQQCNYLEAAPDGWYDGSGDPGLHACYGTREGTFIFGEGAYNTVGLATGCYDRFGWGYDINETSDLVVDRYTNNGKSDWFIPSKPELNELCKYARGITTGNLELDCDSSGSLKSGFTPGVYLSSSTGENMKYRHDIWFNDGTQTYLHGFDAQQLVRPIRAF